jgi:hypothetical protein
VFKRSVINLFLALVGLATMLLPLQAMAVNDPTRPANYAGSTSSAKRSLKLESILYSTDRRVAVISGKVLAEGDSIENKIVTAITKDAVTLTSNGKALILKLQHTSIRKGN